MNSLVVWAAPDGDPFDELLFATVVGALHRAGHDVRAIDLVGEKYEPFMDEAEWLAYRDLAPQPDDVVARHIADVTWAQQLVFVYPTCWQGLPAVLKGWLERTMVPGVAFELDEAGRARGALVHLRRIVGVTTYRSSPWMVRAMGDAGRRTLTRALRLSCRHPWRARCRWLAMHRRDRAGTAGQAAFLRRVDAQLATVGALEARRRPAVGA